MLLAQVACERGSAPSAPPAPPSAPTRAPAKIESVRSSAAAVASAPPPSPVAVLKRDAYPWLAELSLGYPAPVDCLEARFVPPPGFERVSLPKGSFGAWLRGLPLAAPGTPVRTYAGTVRYAADDPRVAAVVAIDVGQADLQQCADAVVRLHAEWCWSRGRKDISYRAAAGMSLPFERYLGGESDVLEGQSLRRKAGRRRPAQHRSLRRYLDMVFAWANTQSIARQATPVALDQLRPGDFFILPGNPGHAVIVADLARAAGRGRAALLLRSYIPAQSIYVLRPDSASVWFWLDPTRAVKTPFWEPFPWGSLRRLDG